MKYRSCLWVISLIIMVNSYGMEEKHDVLSLRSLALIELILDHAQKIKSMEEPAAQEMLMLTASSMQHKVPEELQSYYLPEVARTHYFLFNKYFDVGCKYGFSVGELIAYNRIQYVIRALFTRACYLKNSFVIDKNYHINSLKGLEAIPLKQYITELVINHNQLTTISPHFSCLPQLEKLDLSHNTIKTIEDDAFKGLSKLTTLDLSRNNLEKINYHSFVGCRRLMILNLNDNEIDVIESGSFADLVRLNILNLINNQLSVAPQELFELNQVRILMLGENSISEKQQEELEQTLDDTIVSWQKRSLLSSSRTYIRTMHDDAT